MIESTKAYKTSDGITHPTIEAAQAHALEQIGLPNSTDILAKKDQVLAILKLKTRKARTVKPSKAKKPSTTPSV